MSSSSTLIVDPPHDSSSNKRMWNTLTHMLALNRSAQYLQEKEGTGYKLNQLDPAHMRVELEKMFYEVHGKLFQDTHSAEQYGIDRAGNVDDSNKRIEVRSALHAMADDLFDANARAVGMPKERLAEIYARHYIELRKVEPFKYGNQLTLSTFFTAVSQIPFEKNIEGTSIDFRRLDATDLEAFKPNNGVALDKEDIRTAFLHALDQSRDVYIPNQRAKAEMLSVPGDNKPNPNKLVDNEVHDHRILQGWPDKTVEIAGVPFLGFEKDNKLCLVTVTGGLVAYETA